jgi:hypothetical protein
MKNNYEKCFGSKQEMNPNFRMDDPLNQVHMRFVLRAQGNTS